MYFEIYLIFFGFEPSKMYFVKIIKYFLKFKGYIIYVFCVDLRRSTSVLPQHYEDPHPRMAKFSDPHPRMSDN